MLAGNILNSFLISRSEENSNLVSDRELPQLKLSSPFSIVTQGRGNIQEWVTHFMVSYSLDAYKWEFARDIYGNKKVFKGNSDSHTLRHSYLEHPVKARFVRIHVVDWHGKSFIIFFKKISNSFSIFFNFFLKVILHCEWKLSTIKIVTS